jgi:hypothetical protein
MKKQKYYLYAFLVTCVLYLAGAVRFLMQNDKIPGVIYAFAGVLFALISIDIWRKSKS